MLLACYPDGVYRRTKTAWREGSTYVRLHVLLDAWQDWICIRSWQGSIVTSFLPQHHLSNYLQILHFYSITKCRPSHT
jgi:hypothetical protein